MSDCGSCKKIDKCRYVNADWYPATGIKFCRNQVLWYLQNCDTIRQGEWPQSLDGSSYTDPAIRSNAVRLPSHNCEVISAEIDTRIKACGLEGKLLEYEVKLGYQLSETSWKALNYCSGWRRKTSKYSQWKAEQNRRRKDGIKVT